MSNLGQIHTGLMAHIAGCRLVGVKPLKASEKAPLTMSPDQRLALEVAS